jgi:hypothetical protein
MEEALETFEVKTTGCPRAAGLAAEAKVVFMAVRFGWLEPLTGRLTIPMEVEIKSVAENVPVVVGVKVTMMGEVVVGATVAAQLCCRPKEAALVPVKLQELMISDIAPGAAVFCRKEIWFVVYPTVCKGKIIGLFDRATVAGGRLVPLSARFAVPAEVPIASVAEDDPDTAGRNITVMLQFVCPASDAVQK